MPIEPNFRLLQERLQVRLQVSVVQESAEVKYHEESPLQQDRLPEALQSIGVFGSGFAFFLHPDTRHHVPGVESGVEEEQFLNFVVFQRGLVQVEGGRIGVGGAPQSTGCQPEVYSPPACIHLVKCFLGTAGLTHANGPDGDVGSRPTAQYPHGLLGTVQAFLVKLFQAEVLGKQRCGCEESQKEQYFIVVAGEAGELWGWWTGAWYHKQICRCHHKTIPAPNG